MSRARPEFVETIDQIRAAEQDAAAAVDAARQAAEARLDAARRAAAERIAAARREGAAAGDHRLTEERDAIKREAERIVAGAEQRADRLREQGAARMPEATALALRVILGEDT